MRGKLISMPRVVGNEEFFIDRMLDLERKEE